MPEFEIPPTLRGLGYAIAFAVLCFCCAAAVERVAARRKNRKI